jgi:hypothetical protein
MSLKTFVSRSFAVQSCIAASVAFVFACNAAYGRHVFGYDLASTLLVGTVCGALIAAAIGLTDFMTFYAGRTKDFAMCNLMGVTAAVTIYNWNVVTHMNVLGWTLNGFFVCIVLGLVSGNAYAAACTAAKKLTE